MDERPAVAPGGPDLVEHRERFAQVPLGLVGFDFIEAAAVNSESEGHRLAAAARLGERLRLLEQRDRSGDVAAHARDGGELGLGEALELRPSGSMREVEHRVGVSCSPVGVAEPPEDRRDQRVSVVEADQFVVGQDCESRVGEIMCP